MPSEQVNAIRTRFTVGSRVRVKFGVKDPDFPDNDLGDSRGTIIRIGPQETANCLIQWSCGTLAGFCPACRDFCEREDRSLDAMWLLGEDLEPDSAARSARKRRGGVAADLVSC